MHEFVHETRRDRLSRRRRSRLEARQRPLMSAEVNRGNQRLPETAETPVVWLITQRSRVQIPPPLPGETPPGRSSPGAFRSPR